MIGLRRQQALDLGQCLLRLVVAMQRLGIVLARGLKARRQFQTACQQPAGIFVTPQARGDLGEHADRGDIGRRLLQVFAQQGLGLGNAGFRQRRGGSEQARVAGGITNMVGVGGVGTILVAGSQEMVAECAPGLRQVRFQRYRSAQRIDRILAAPMAPQGETQVKVNGRPARLCLREWRKNSDGPLQVALRRLRRRQQLQRGGVAVGCFEDFDGLFASQHRIAFQQARGMSQRLFQCAGRGGGVVHAARLLGCAAGGAGQGGGNIVTTTPYRLTSDRLQLLQQSNVDFTKPEVGSEKYVSPALRAVAVAELMAGVPPCLRGYRSRTVPSCTGPGAGGCRCMR